MNLLSHKQHIFFQTSKQVLRHFTENVRVDKMCCEKVLALFNEYSVVKYVFENNILYKMFMNLFPLKQHIS